MTGMSTTAEHRSLDAEVRAVENGHQARLAPGRRIRVKSDTVDGQSWIVTTGPVAPGARVVFRCEAAVPTLVVGHGHFPLASTPGCACCQHAATAARRLEREGLVRWDTGRWIATGRGAEPVTAPADPFEGFPTW